MSAAKFTFMIGVMTVLALGACSEGLVVEPGPTFNEFGGRGPGR